MDIVSNQSPQESVQHTCTSLYEDDVELPYVIGEVEVKNSEQSSTGNTIMSQRLDKCFRFLGSDYKSYNLLYLCIMVCHSILNVKFIYNKSFPMFLTNVHIDCIFHFFWINFIFTIDLKYLLIQVT